MKRSLVVGASLTVLATVALAAGPAPETKPAATSKAFLSSPFKGDFASSGVFDHDLEPAEPWRQRTSWDTLTFGKPGHPAWDYSMPEGTPVYAAADGVLSTVHDGALVTCPGGRKAESTAAWLRTTAPDGTVYELGYLHLRQVSFRVGDRVRRGQQLGTSGSSGCATGPHLHFAVKRMTGTEGALVDPYGWFGARPDPMEAVGRGSPPLWLEGQAPVVRRIRADKPRGEGAVRITALQAMGWRDDLNPNHEFVEIGTPTGAAAQVSLDGLSLQTRAGETYRFPRGYRIRIGDKVRIYTGRGENQPGTLYWGKSAGVWDDAEDCARLVDREGTVLAAYPFGARREEPCER